MNRILDKIQKIRKSNNNNTLKKFVNLFDFVVFRLIPDNFIIKLTYKRRLGFFPNLKNPRLLSEKIQWLKLHSHKKKHSLLVDKVLVKNYIRKNIGPEYLIPTLFSGKKPEKIPFSKLPERYIIKTNHGSGQIIIVMKNEMIFNKKKQPLDKHKIIKYLKQSLKHNYYHTSKEKCYRDVVPQVLIEPLLEDNLSKISLTDYKIHCFNGEPEFIQVIFNRPFNTQENWIDKNGKFHDFVYTYPNNVKFGKIKKLKEMLSLAKKLCKEFKYVRVDFYLIKNQIYFGELTLYPAGGTDMFQPALWDRKLGDLLDLK